jgi:hypothetical protein
MLDDLIPAGTFVGTSLILRKGGRFLYGVRPPQAEGTRTVLELTGIGGGMEPEDESVTVGVLREVQEEIACAVLVLESPETLLVRGPGRVERVTLQGQERPVAVVFRHWPTPPHEPWQAGSKLGGCLVVFLADLLGTPRPAAELPALAWLSTGQVVSTAQRDVPLQELLDEGATLVERAGEGLPRAAWARLTDSQEALALALGEKAETFYRALDGRRE